MRVRNKSIGLIFTLIGALALSVTQLAAQDGSDSDKKLAQSAAQHFVKRLQETRDIGPLITEMFFPDFVAYFACQNENQIPDFYDDLSRSERLGLFKVQINATYLVSIDVLRGTDHIRDTTHSKGFTGVLPPAMAERLRKVLIYDGKPPKFSGYKDFKVRLPKIEKVLLEIQNYLKKSGIEQTSEFRQALDDRITGRGLNYRVRVGTVDGSEMICGKFGTLPANRTIFRVETPLFFGLLFVKDGNQMKIVFVDAADDD